MIKNEKKYKRSSMLLKFPQEKRITPELIDANKGFLGTGGELLKVLMEEKKKKWNSL